MSDTVIVGILTFIASLGSAAFVSIGNRNKTIDAVKDELRTVREESKASDSEIHGEMLLIRKDISTLSDRVEKHNSVIERVYQLEKSKDVFDEKMRVANHRIDDLEKGK